MWKFHRQYSHEISRETNSNRKEQSESIKRNEKRECKWYRFAITDFLLMRLTVFIDDDNDEDDDDDDDGDGDENDKYTFVQLI